MLPDAYGCVVANRFGGLLDDDVDPFDLINEAEAETEREKMKKKKKKKEEEEKKNKQKKPGQKESQKERRVPRGADGPEPLSVRKQPQARPAGVPASANDSEQNQRGMKRAAAGQRRDRQEDHPQEFSSEQPSYNPDSDPRGRGGHRGRRGGGRGGGSTRNPDDFNTRGKREYDRHDRTGVSTEEKRGGRGPWNWGSVKEAESEVMEVTPDAPLKGEEPQMTAEEENPSGVTNEDDGEIVVQVSMEMSLDEWKALQETKRPKAEFNIRKAEDKIPSKAKVIHQSKNLEISKAISEDVEDEGNFLRKSVNDITTMLDINFGSLGRPTRGGRGRGGRGGQSVRPERAAAALERDELAPNPDDPDDFPALTAGN